VSSFIFVQVGAEALGEQAQELPVEVPVPVVLGVREEVFFIITSLVRETSLGPNARVIIYICPGGHGGSGGAGIQGTGGAGGEGGGPIFKTDLPVATSFAMNFSPVVPNSTVSETAPLIPQPEPQAYAMVCLP
jgi:hypothetical protein